MEKLIIKDLNVSYIVKKNKIDVLRDFSMTLNNGEFLVILGSSGCGKTTLLKAITGSIDYDSGTMIINGIDANRLPTQNRNLAYVSQSFFTYSFMSVYNNIALPLKAAKVPLEEIERRVNEVAELLDISYLLSRKPRQLSGGQQQKVAIAKALIKKPDIYLFDEPFSNLDIVVRAELKKYLKTIKKQYNASMIFVTHDISDALDLADRIIVLSEHGIVQEGTPTEIVKHPCNEYVKTLIESGGKK